jgi:hypothetical protein
VMHDGIFGIARGIEDLEPGASFQRPSASWRPFMPPGRITSVNKRWIQGH